MANKTWLGGSTAGVNSLNVAANWSPSGVPTGSDNIYITATSTNSILNDLTTLSTVDGELHVEAGFDFLIGGSTAGYLQMNASEVYFAGTGKSYLQTTSSEVTVTGTASLGIDIYGLNLKSTAIDVLNMAGGDVGVATDAGVASAITSVRVLGGDLTLGESCTYTAATLSAGRLTVFGGTTSSDLDVYGGTFTGREEWQARAINMWAGTATLGGSGPVKALTIRGGRANTLTSGIARTFAAVTLHYGTFRYDPDILTVTSWGTPETPVKLTASSN